MRLKRFVDANEFYPHVEPYLVAREAEHNLMLGLCATLMKTDTYQEPPYLACVEDSDGVVAVAMRTPPFNLVLSEVVSDTAIPLVAENVAETHDTLPGVLGPKCESKAFADLWHQINGVGYHVSRAERVYRLQRVCSPHGVGGTMRPAVEADREMLIEWWVVFFDEALDGTSREEAQRAVEMRLSSAPAVRGLRVWHDRGQPVAFVGYGGPTPNGIRIGPVYTPPEFRKRGYASALTAALSQELLDSGCKFCFLYTDLSNPTSNHIYQTIGYEPVCDVDEYRFDNKQ